SPSPTPQQGTPQQGMSPVISDPSPASPITGSGPPPLSPVPPPANGSSRSSARRSWLAALAALVVVALVLGGVLLLQELRQDDSPAAPDPGLGSGWSDGEKVGSTWKYTNDDQKLALAVNRSITEGESVADAATEHVDSEQMDDYKVEVDRELSDEQRGKWESGWQLQYARTGGSGDCDYFWRWYFGNNAPATAGWVEICGADKADIKHNDDAVEILAQVRDELMDGEESRAWLRGVVRPSARPRGSSRQPRRPHPTRGCRSSRSPKHRVQLGRHRRRTPPVSDRVRSRPRRSRRLRRAGVRRHRVPRSRGALRRSRRCRCCGTVHRTPRLPPPHRVGAWC